MSYFTWDMGSDVLDDWAARGVCSSCHVQLDLEDGCPDCDEKCEECGKYLWQEEDTRVSEELLCNECWSVNG
jgi:PHP family Zn ribbon phosphoesterase